MLCRLCALPKSRCYVNGMDGASETTQPITTCHVQRRRTLQGDDIIGQKFHSSLACVARGSHTVALPVIGENRPSDSDGVSAPRHHDMSGKHAAVWYVDGACDSADAESCCSAKKNCVAALVRREYHPGRYPWHFHLAPHRGLSVRRPPSARLELATICQSPQK